MKRLLKQLRLSAVSEIEILGQEEVRELSKKLLEDNKAVKLRLGGQSMYPTFRSGDIGIVEPTGGLLPEIGQIVVYRSNERWIAHRLVKRQIIDAEEVFVLQGDSLMVSDAVVKNQQVLGIIHRIERAGISKKSRSIVTWVYVHLRPIPQGIGRLVLKIKRSF